MGGGDLNLKKSWHPSTLKNQERVWKAEQQKIHEDRKIAELQRELREERTREELQQSLEVAQGSNANNGKELNWMYKGPGSHVSREEYLLGRKIDKSFEMLEKDEAKEDKMQDQSTKSTYTVEHEINPESVIQKDVSNVQVDMKRKLLEDPLLMIRQNEEATKRAITSNPVKMKQLQLLLSSLKDKKKKKKKKKHKSVDCDSSDGKKRKKKKKEKKKKKKKVKRKKSSKKGSSSNSSSQSSESECETSDEEKNARRKKLKKLIDRETKRAAMNRHTSPPPQTEKKPQDRGRDFNSQKNKMDSRDRSHRNQERFLDQRNKKRLSRSRSREKRNQPGKSEERHQSKLKFEEMTKKREEMIANASKRDLQRKENVEKYKEGLKLEENEEKDSEDFLRNLGGTSVGSSLESRIRSKVGFSQKGIGHMNTNFLKK